VPGPDSLFSALPLAGWTPVLGYGPAPGVEFIPYFLALLAWAGMALAGVLLWPITGLLRRLRKLRNARPPAPKGEPGTDDSSSAGNLR
jgi:hypothetical protein